MLRIIIKSFIFFSLMATLPACKKGGGNAPSQPLVTGDYQLVYGSTASDRELLQQRITGSNPPKMAEVIQRWKRFSGATFYNDASAIVASPANCYTSLDGNGMWALNGSLDPNTHASCNTPTMNSLSWIYLTGPDRLFNIQNTNNYVGFFSSIKFDKYTSSADFSSTDLDDDSIGMTIAVVHDGVDVYTLTAVRTQGGNVPVNGWALIHKKNNTIVRTIGNISVGGTNKNSSPTTGDAQGWNGRATRVKVVRDGNIIKAYTSVWNTNASQLVIDEGSLIQVDLSDPAEGLTMFVGPQPYGFESYSQSKATFSNLQFSTPSVNVDPDYLFDLVTNRVYSKKVGTIGYELVTGLKALDMLGYPKEIKNIETQRQFKIESSTSYFEIL